MEHKVQAILTSSPVIKRYDKNPILSAKDVPYEADLIFNAGVVKFQGKYIMVFRNDYFHSVGGDFKGTNMGVAFSHDGITWKAENKTFFSMEDITDPEIERFYDPRLTVIEGKCYICFAADTRHGLRGGIGIVNEHFDGFKVISMTVPDNRNMVLFPEKINNKYLRLERPFPVYSRGKDRFDTWISASPDLKFWGESSLLLTVEDVPFANDKTGPGAPPVKTDKGWLTLFHSVDIDYTRGKNGWEDIWQKRYCAGIMLLDLHDPSKIIGLSKEPLLAPETDYEINEGYRTNVIFPGGMILEDSGEVKIYYGAADTVECLATADVDDLLNLCKPL